MIATVVPNWPVFATDGGAETTPRAPADHLRAASYMVALAQIGPSRACAPAHEVAV